jgi:hypothetical protein
MHEGQHTILYIRDYSILACNSLIDTLTFFFHQLAHTFQKVLFFFTFSTLAISAVIIDQTEFSGL